MSSNHKIFEVSTEPYEGQLPGTSGLRQKVEVFKQKNYTENFIQCALVSFGKELQDSSFIIGGDGRYYMKEVIKKIIQICASNGVKKLIIGQHGLLSTPAVSCLIRQRKTNGGIILTASHNPGGVEGDFGIKVNLSNGGPAPTSVTNKIHQLSEGINKYFICPSIQCDIDKIGKSEYKIEGNNVITVEVIDSVSDYVTLMMGIFDFPLLKKHIQGGFKILVDCMAGATCPYAKAIFVDELGAEPNSVVHGTSLEDFGGHHPDPNLTYAADLVKHMKTGTYDFGCAFDGDGDRNMILGRNAFFVTPSDSLAVLSNNLECIPYFQRGGVEGFARSMPTAGAVDLVAQKKKKRLFVVPTGWKFFGNLMDADLISLCGEESFGTGSTHIREKDGIWAALAWLTVIANRKKSVEEVVREHWAEYGRNSVMRYDYENCDAHQCKKMMDYLDQLVSKKSTVGTCFTHGGKTRKVAKAENFRYADPVDHSITEKQGIQIVFEDLSRIVFRLSGTGSVGATVRLYVDSYEKDPAKVREADLKSLGELAIELAKIKVYTGREKPNVIT